MIKVLKILAAVAGILVALALVYLGVRFVPGVVAGALARDLALDAGFDSYAALAVALVAGVSATAVLVLLWRGFSWRKVGIATLVIPLVLAGYFAGKSILRDR